MTYTQTSHAFDVAIIFSSFTLFQLLRQPLLFLPRALSAIADAESALQRLQHVFHAELREDVAIVIEPTLEKAIVVESATFEWEESVAHTALGGQKNEKGEKGEKDGGKGKNSSDGTEDEKKVEDAAPFRVQNVTLSIPRGQLTAIVGPVGSGKVRVVPYHFPPFD